MANGDVHIIEMVQKRLHILYAVLAGSGVTHMSDGTVTGQPLQIISVLEDFADQTKIAVHQQFPFIT
ncbi:hypothetical protein SDC9_60284 [bioreactor metagenome]|uniref:Uncharacterized protein n=1 Tax=bioreactor metagenome TaxID=1076179 RepID=A0A644XIK1_9ZZZZ